MTNLADDYIDLLASGDKEKIRCVLFSAGAAAAIGGIAAGKLSAPANFAGPPGTAFNGLAAGIGAVLGGLLAIKVSYNACGAESTRGSFEKILSSGNIKVNSGAIGKFETELIIKYSLTANEARKLTKAAYVYSLSAPQPNLSASVEEQKYGLTILLEKLKAQGVA